MAQMAGGFGLSAHEIYQQVTGGPGPHSLDAAYEATRLEFELEEQRAREISQLAEAIKQGWQGEAADAAHGAAAPMADTARERNDNLRMAQMALESQSASFRHTVNSVVPVPPNPPEGNIVNDMIPWETDLDAEIKQYQNNAQHNLVVYGGYDDHSMHNEQIMPRDYPSTTDWSGNISVSESGSPSGGRPPSGGEFQPRGSSSWSPSGGPGSVDVPDSATGSPPQPPGVSQLPQGTDPSEATQPPGTPPSTRPPVVQPPANQPSFSGLPPVGGWPPGTVPPLGGRPPGLGPEGGRGSGSGGPFGRGGGGGADGGPGGRSTGAPGGPGARGGALGEPGARPGALAAEEAARRGGLGAAGARGAGGAGGFAPVGAGRPAGGDDEEHQRKYTIEPDPEEMFGTEERTAPPVIGLEQD